MACSMPWTKQQWSDINRRWTGTFAWVLLALSSMVLIGYGIVSARWHTWLPSSEEQEDSWNGSLYIFAGCAVSLVAAGGSQVRGNPVGDRLRWAAGDSRGLGTLDRRIRTMRTIASPSRRNRKQS